MRFSHADIDLCQASDITGEIDKINVNAMFRQLYFIPILEPLDDVKS